MNPDEDQWVSSDAVRTRFREILDGVAYGSNHVYVRRYGKPAAVIVPVEWHDARLDTTDLGKRGEPPTSIAQARARVTAEMDHLEANCAIALDVGYARQCLGEAIDDYIEMALGLIR